MSAVSFLVWVEWGCLAVLATRHRKKPVRREMEIFTDLPTLFGTT